MNVNVNCLNISSPSGHLDRDISTTIGALAKEPVEALLRGGYRLQPLDEAALMEV